MPFARFNAVNGFYGIFICAGLSSYRGHIILLRVGMIVADKWGMPAIPRLTDKQAARFKQCLTVRGECWDYTRNTIGAYSNGGIRDMAYRFGLAIVQDVPPELCVRHLCNNPKCCNPAHLLLGTRAENNTDRRIMRACRIKHGCSRGADCGSCATNPLLVVYHIDTR